MRRRKRKTATQSNNQASDFIDQELVDIAKLWTLRILFNLRKFEEFIDRDGHLRSEEILVFLGGAKYLEDERDDKEVRKDIYDDFYNQLKNLENKDMQINKSATISKNIEKLAKVVPLNKVEKSLLAFIILIKQYEILDDAVSLLGSDLATKQAKQAMGIILNIPYKRIDKALKSDGVLSQSSLLLADKMNRFSLDRKFDSISDKFIDDMANSDEDILTMLSDIFYIATASTLELKDYNYVKKDIAIIKTHLKKAIKQKQKGVNILLYGVAGTGKTELSKLLSKELRTTLYEVSSIDENGDAMDGVRRVKAYKSAQALLSGNRVIMYDEAEDIFESFGGGFFSAPTRQKDKAWINTMLENNPVPTIWITNNIDAIDDAIVRRFDYALHLPIPSKKQRKKIVAKYSQGMLDKKSTKLLVKNTTIAPAIIARAAKVVQNISSQNPSKDFIRVIDNTIKAQGYMSIKQKPLKQKKEKLLPSLYKPEFINSDTNLEELKEGIKKNPNARLCLYGPAGTGKSAYGRYIAKTLKKPFILKKGSDLLSMYVGGTEKNIAAAFAEAKRKKAVLVFDEVDSFLSERGNAKRSWEVSQVNEMLVQMENFDGIFIATTNLMKNLDKASLRRFDLKLKFDFLKPTQAWEIFVLYHEELEIQEVEEKLKKEFLHVKQLTPGDFAAVLRQSRFRPIKTSKEFLERLLEEVVIKNIEQESKVMGFVRG